MNMATSSGGSVMNMATSSGGPVMNMATSSGRILHPSNFAKEIFLSFNLPILHLHILMDNLVPDILTHGLFDKKKEFIRRTDRDPRQLRKLSSMSASIGNFGYKEEATFHGVNVKHK